MEFAPADGVFNPELAGDLNFRAYVPGTPLETKSSDSSVVLRVRIPRDTDLGDNKNLIVQPHYLWHVTGWFKYEDQQQWNSVVVGRLLPPTAATIPPRIWFLRSKGKLAEGMPIYLRIRETAAQSRSRQAWSIAGISD